MGSAGVADRRRSRDTGGEGLAEVSESLRRGNVAVPLTLRPPLLRAIAVLLNIDKPLRTAVLHENDCRHIPDPYGTENKPVGRLGRDGGWFEIESEAQANATAQEHFPKAEVVRCQKC